MCSRLIVVAVLAALFPAPAGALTLEELVGGASFTTDNDLTFSEFGIVLYDYELDLAATDVVQLPDGFQLGFGWEGLPADATPGFDLVFTVSRPAPTKAARKKATSDAISLFAENDQDGTLPFSDSGSLVFPDDPLVTEARAELEGTLAGVGSVEVLTGPSGRKKAARKKAATDAFLGALGTVDEDPLVFADDYETEVFLAGAGEATLAFHFTAPAAEAAVPEPGGALLFAAGVGVVGVGIRRRRRG